MNPSCVPGHWALKTNPSVLWVRSVGLSVEFSQLLGAQAGRHCGALRRCTSALGEKTKDKQCYREIADKKKCRKNTTEKERGGTRGIVMSGNMKSRCSAVQSGMYLWVFVDRWLNTEVMSFHATHNLLSVYLLLLPDVPAGLIHTSFTGHIYTYTCAMMPCLTIRAERQFCALSA